MQDLLHHALTSAHVSGLLAGRENTIEAIFPVTESKLMAPESDDQSTELIAASALTLMGIYQATDSDGNIDAGQIYQLSSYFEKQSGKLACCHLLLELSTEGRLDALMFADPEHNIPIPLEMQED